MRVASVLPSATEILSSSAASACSSAAGLLLVMVVWFDQLDGAVDACAAAGIPFCSLWVWFGWSSVLNEVRHWITDHAARILPIVDRASATWEASWASRAAAFTALVVATLSHSLETMTWFAGSVLRLPRRHMLPLLGGTRLLAPAVWASLGVCLSDAFGLTPSHLRLSPRNLLSSALGGLTRGGAREVDGSRPPMALWLAAAAVWCGADFLTLSSMNTYALIR
ncbi:hypothetical protein EMIHUDRAFT_252081 [Emiliania huxleyi CCMP1516]|uniref:Wax synthase domain-containing protein n=2 Tax=Emiliania huxleyi TaxID=2903 RepID=A0A0D3KNW5_EMIH1|nr:hypothetical protein EMIHUDRAFT_252081 [Emiliania huxleyi CCMP1516]EOD37450.1 hypothetical protein EMIHUDRAFT_252081 [Emiliania huxleyi CCMP1516]|eukprot:XP_005789879.1 hypothetical protein EMIHUDRAFT_252081 [Emiliania huxleyi CCMP1516]